MKQPNEYSKECVLTWILLQQVIETAVIVEGFMFMIEANFYF